MGEIPEESTKLGHLERTVGEPRDLSLNHVTIKRIDEVNPTVRLFRLEIHEPEGIKFLPGQWLDVYVPNPLIPQAGGFTITCSPSKAIPTHSPSSSSFSTGSNNTKANETSQDGYPYLYLELAIQQSPLNPVASYLWQSPLAKILNKALKVRVGGSFVFPPFPFFLISPPHPPRVPLEHEHEQDTHKQEQHPEKKPLSKVIFLAGGVGVNPLMSMLSYIGEEFPPAGSDLQDPARRLQVHFLYSVKDPNPDQPLDDETSSNSQILFLNRISSLFSEGKISGKFKLFLTQPAQPTQPKGHSTSSVDSADENPPGQYSYPIYKRRISKQDITSALGPDKDTSAVYICGVPAMTDYFVELLTSPEDSGGFGMDTDRVLFEKWW